MKNIDFGKGSGLVPAVIQDNNTKSVLMVGFMNAEALEKTVAEGFVTFFSRSKNRLWKKGETSGNFLKVVSISADCDNDSLLIRVIPNGPVCHTGSYSCFNEAQSASGFLNTLESIISQRIDSDQQGSYTNRLFREGMKRMAQKVGEEAVELVIESSGNDTELFRNEAADLLYHLLILMKAKGVRLSDIEKVLEGRHNKQ
jgi:phosphoribosyl-ATP pyrophosphohydrolase/phosphoribosyl-AMP cyclohydrolase